jgi:hypothetical protein
MIYYINGTLYDREFGDLNSSVFVKGIWLLVTTSGLGLLCATGLLILLYGTNELINKI